MDTTQGNIIIALLIIIAILIAGKRVSWLRYDTGGNESNVTRGHERDSDEKSVSRPSLKVEPKPISA